MLLILFLFALSFSLEITELITCRKKNGELLTIKSKDKAVCPNGYEPVVVEMYPEIFPSLPQEQKKDLWKLCEPLYNIYSICYEAGGRGISCISARHIVYTTGREKLGPFFDPVLHKIADFCEVACVEGKRDPQGWRKMSYSYFFNYLCNK